MGKTWKDSKENQGKQYEKKKNCKKIEPYRRIEKSIRAKEFQQS